MVIMCQISYSFLGQCRSMEYEYRNMMLHRTLFQHLKPWSEERTPPGGRVLYMYMLAVVCADDIMYVMSFI